MRNDSLVFLMMELFFLKEKFGYVLRIWNGKMAKDLEKLPSCHLAVLPFCHNLREI
jgi:hypothetical protein